MFSTTKDVLKEVNEQRQRNALLNENGLELIMMANQAAAATPQELEAKNKEALLEEYTRLRHEEYEMTVQNEAMKFYNACRDSGDINSKLWYGLKDTKSASDTAAVLVPELTSYRGPNATCAISASALTLQINRKMNEGCPDGVETKEIISKDGSVNIKTASTFTKTPGAAGYVYTGQKTINELMLSQECPLNAGDAISFRIKAPYTSPRTGQQRSGCHAMVLTDVTRDESGIVTSYTLQGNNPTYLATYQRKGNKFATKGRDYGNKTVESAILTHRWMDNQISAERECLQSLSVEELQAQVEKTRNRVVGTYNASTKQCEGGLMGELAQTEQYNLKCHYNKDVGVSYKLEHGMLLAENSNLAKDNLQLRTALNEAEGQKLAAEYFGRLSKGATVDLNAVKELKYTAMGREVATPEKKKKNVFQKMGSWATKAAKDTVDWCVGAFNTVTGKNKKIQPQIDGVKIAGAPTLAAVSPIAKSAHTVAAQPAPELAVTNFVAQNRTAVRETSATKLMEKKEKTMQTVHDFWEMLPDTFSNDTKDSMSGASLMLSALLKRPEELLDGFVSVGETKNVMQEDWNKFSLMMKLLTGQDMEAAIAQANMENVAKSTFNTSTDFSPVQMMLLTGRGGNGSRG